MKIDIPFKIEYLVDDVTPISDVIDGLIAAKTLIEEGTYNIPIFIRGIDIQRVDINVSRITQESPLRELLLVTLFITFQKDLESEVPSLFENLTGIEVSDRFDTLITISTIIVLFYGAAFAKDFISGVVVDSPLRAQLNAMIAEMASLTGLPEATVKAKLDQRYKPANRLKMIAASAIKFIRPSRRQNAGVVVGDTRIEPRLVEQFPEEYAYEDATTVEKSEPFTGTLYLHAQDRDKENAGWAAIPMGICDKRLRMKLVDGVTADQLWNRDYVMGSGVIKYKRVGAEFVPNEIHLGRVLD